MGQSFEFFQSGFADVRVTEFQISELGKFARLSIPASVTWACEEIEPRSWDNPSRCLSPASVTLVSREVQLLELGESLDVSSRRR